MIVVPFDSGTKFDGKCKIIFDENTLNKTFDIVNEHSVIVRSYRIKTKIENNYQLKFFVICPNGEEIPIKVDSNSITYVIACILVNETANTTLKEIKRLVEEFIKPKSEEGEDDEIS